MNLSLSNTLGKRMAINPDGLSLDLAFALDKTLVARKGPTPTFTRASTATFIGSNGLIQSAAINEPRFDHDPVTLDCRGLLIEEARTNATVQSNGFSSSPWGENSGTATLAQNQTGPDGISNSAWTFTDDSATSVEGRFQLRSLTSGSTNTISAFVRKTTGTPTNFPCLSAVRGGAQANGVVINTTTGVVIPITVYSSTAVTTTTVSSQDFGNYWRVSATFVAGATVNHDIVLLPAFNSTGDGVLVAAATGSAVFYGHQLEAGAFATSYIPTTTAALTRSADVCSISGANFTSFYNQSQGTIIASGSLDTTTTNAGPVVFKSNDGTNNNRIQIGMTNVPTEAVRPFVTSGGVLTYSLANGTATVGVERKIGTAYNTNDAISVFNGTLGTQDTSVTIPTVNQATIGSSFSGRISRLQYFKKRLPNAKLQTLTT